MKTAEIVAGACGLGVSISRTQLWRWSCLRVIGRPSGPRKFPVWPQSVIGEAVATRTLLQSGFRLREIALARKAMIPVVEGRKGLSVAVEELLAYGERNHKLGVEWLRIVLKAHLGICPAVRANLVVKIDGGEIFRGCCVDNVQAVPSDGLRLSEGSGN